ncbi:16S rRNA (guanine(966)-N(2))-methyltransferase RsmD [Pseudoflavonifractor sp. HCP28S3_F10]|uniref:16S rRNA (guanine(966)-N(2))-methyltransferase RsmD n=1 Tax=Pseudoflavonifractor sp. HCP28S3_F10 TaxID=3438947 RepID=UPI002A861E0E|nr:16S rRNA (guanine(966)-N(2))-methyltransferase RsmD [Pseudoflavonifractor sp.]
MFGRSRGGTTRCREKGRSAMRVITGTARGRKLRELPGMETRPTTDKVKESIFNIIQFDIEGRRVLDLFGGTGQLGIEALSRGAAHCTFVDLRREAAAVIRENLQVTRLADQARVVQGDSLSFLASCREKFDLILLDPPYASGLLEKAVKEAAAIDILTENGIMVCESAADQVLPALEAPYEKGREYRYGKIKITLYRRGL